MELGEIAAGCHGDTGGGYSVRTEDTALASKNSATELSETAHFLISGERVCLDFRENLLVFL
jgi:hypothetical protein